MPETQQRLEFRFLVEVAEDGEIEAYCIDAGAVGVGATILAAITEMVSALEAMYEVASRRWTPGAPIWPAFTWLRHSPDARPSCSK
jgi:hypothetical protein